MITESSVSSEEIIINARAAQIVWDVVLDFDNYGVWSTFCPSMKGEAVIGSPLEMQVDMGNGPQLQVEYVTKLEPIHTVVWSMENKPGDPIHADRMQRITPWTTHVVAISVSMNLAVNWPGRCSSKWVRLSKRGLTTAPPDSKSGLKAHQASIK